MEYEINLGERSLTPPVQVDMTLFASVSGTASQLADDEIVFLQKSSGINHIMTLDALQAMSLTQHFKPMHEHIAHIEQSMPVLRGQHQAIKQVLEFMQKRQLLISADQWLEHLQKKPEKLSAVSYAGMVIRTCNRPDNLGRLIESLEQYYNIHNKEDAILVFDDSTDIKSRENNRKICDSAKINIKYFGQIWQKQFISMLKTQFPEFSDQIEWLLSERDGFTGGRVWNLALLSLAGKKFSFYDDDYLLQPRKLKNSNKIEIDLSDPIELDVGFGLNIREIKQNSQEEPSDVIAQMVDACGQNFGHWLTKNKELTPKTLSGMSLLDLQRLGKKSIIKTTGNGTWGSPRAESNYWLYLLKGDQREAFWSDRETYLDNIEASHLLHYSADYQIKSLANFSPSVIDNSSLTPFSMPVNKNEDHFFNCLMYCCYPDQVSMHFPFMMGHIQDTTRKRSSFNHIARRPNFNNFVADYALSTSDFYHSEDPFARLQSVTATIDDLRTSTDQMIENRLREYMTKTRSDLVFALQQQLSEVPDAPIYWQADVREIIQANGKAVKTNKTPVLSDWDQNMTTQNCISKVRHDLEEIASAMKVWPKLWQFCKTQ